MPHAVKCKIILFFASGIALLAAGCAAPPPPRVVVMPPPHHPAYLHALSDLRTARWLIEHRPGDPAQGADEIEAIRQIDAGISDIKKAAIDDGKNLNYRPAVDAHPDRPGRIHEALQYLRKARADISREEDNAYADGLRDRAIGHIDGALYAAGRVLSD